mgnify:CR=1 FL=1
MVNTYSKVGEMTTSDGVPLKVLKQKAQLIEKEILRIDGISQVTIAGFPDEEIDFLVAEALIETGNAPSEPT